MAHPDRRATGVSKRIWLALYSQGGRWTVAEICSEIPELNRANADRLLSRLAAVGTLKRIAASDEHHLIRYAVTRECRVPRGVTLEELRLEEHA